MSNKKVGVVCVDNIGLYTHFRCQCSFPREGIYRIVAHYGTVRIDLGICIPDGDMFVTEAKIPRKYLNEEIPGFNALEGMLNDGTFVPIRPDECFCHLNALENARFYIRSGQKGLVVNKPTI